MQKVAASSYHVIPTYLQNNFIFLLPLTGEYLQIQLSWCIRMCNDYILNTLMENYTHTFEASTILLYRQFKRQRTCKMYLCVKFLQHKSKKMYKCGTHQHITTDMVIIPLFGTFLGLKNSLLGFAVKCRLKFKVEY